MTFCIDTRIMQPHLGPSDDRPQTPCKVLIVTKDREARGGVANYYRLFFKKYDNPRIRVQRSDIGSRADDYYRRRRRHLQYAVEYVKDVIRFCRTLRREPDIGLVQFSPSLIPVPLVRDGVLIVLTRFLGRKVLVFFRGWRDDIASTLETSRWRRKLFCWVYANADITVVLADTFAASLVRMGFDSGTIRVSKTMFDGDAIARRQPITGNVIRFLFLSRLCPSKGVPEILEAARLLKHKGYPFRIHLYGHGVTNTIIDAFRGRVSMLGVADRVSFHDYVEDAEKFAVYADSDVYLLPSHNEGCPNAVLEAMASGCFVISTAAGALQEVVKDGKGGAIVRVGDSADLADRMEWAIRHPDEVRRLGGMNRAYAFDHFESNVLVQQMVSIYEEVLSGGRE